jgi:hypothetical protein
MDAWMRNGGRTCSSHSTRTNFNLNMLTNDKITTNATKTSQLKKKMFVLGFNCIQHYHRHLALALS